MLYFHGAIIVVSILIFFQDFYTRSIHIVLPLLLMTCCLIINLKTDSLLLKTAGFNLLFLAVNIIGVVLYYSLKEGKLMNPIDKYIGLGDFAFLIAIAPLFSLKSFILFIICGLIFSLICHFVVNIFIKSKTVPLAGYLALFMLLNLTLSFGFNIKSFTL